MLGSGRPDRRLARQDLRRVLGVEPTGVWPCATVFSATAGSAIAALICVAAPDDFSWRAGRRIGRDEQAEVEAGHELLGEVLSSGIEAERSVRRGDAPSPLPAATCVLALTGLAQVEIEAAVGDGPAGRTSPRYGTWL